MNRKCKSNIFMLLLAVTVYVFETAIFYFVIWEKLLSKQLLSYKIIVSFGV